MGRRGMDFEFIGLQQNQVYVLGAVGIDGELLAISWFEHDQLGRLLWVFSSREEADKFVNVQIDREQAYKDYLDREEGENLAAALCGSGATHNATLPTDLHRFSEVLVDIGIETISVDAGSEEPFSRMYQVPAALD